MVFVMIVSSRPPMLRTLSTATPLSSSIWDPPRRRRSSSHCHRGAHTLQLSVQATPCSVHPSCIPPPPKKTMFRSLARCLILSTTASALLLLSSSSTHHQSSQPTPPPPPPPLRGYEVPHADDSGMVCPPSQVMLAICRVCFTSLSLFCVSVQWLSLSSTATS